MTATVEQVAAERTQLLETWTRLFRSRSPFDRMTQPWITLRNRTAKDPGFALRKVHDDLGWASKQTIWQGLCRGALYRTDAFVQTPQGERVGRKKGQTIHIEHTVLSSVLGREWMRADAQTDFTTWMLRHSVCTATTQAERNGGLIRKNFDRRDMTLDDWNGKPFSRYEDDVIVWDVLSGTQVSKADFTFDDHLDNINKLCSEVRKAD